MSPRARFAHGLLRFLASMALALAVMFSLILGLGGCASLAEPYWYKTHAPVIVSDVRTVARPCGRGDLDGCFRRDTSVIELRAGIQFDDLELERGHRWNSGAAVGRRLE